MNSWPTASDVTTGAVIIQAYAALKSASSVRLSVAEVLKGCSLWLDPSRTLLGLPLLFLLWGGEGGKGEAPETYK